MFIDVSVVILQVVNYCVDVELCLETITCSQLVYLLLEILFPLVATL